MGDLHTRHDNPAPPPVGGARKTWPPAIIYPPRSLPVLIGWSLIFLVGLLFIGRIFFSEHDILPPFWATMDYRTIAPEWQYFTGNAIWNLLGAAVSALKGGQLTENEFRIVGIAAVAFCYVAIFASSVIRFGVERAAIFLGCFCLTMLDSTLLHWMGKADPLFVVAYLIAFFGRTSLIWTAVGFALVVGVHPEQSSVLAVIHVLILLLERRLTMRLVAAVGVGLLVGYGAIQIYRAAFDLGEARGRLEYALRDNAAVIRFSIDFVIRWIGLALPSVLLGGWWLAIRAMTDRRSTVLLLGAIGLATAVAATTHDFTRGATLMAMPVIFYLAELFARRWEPGQGLPLKWFIALAFVAMIGYEVQLDRILVFSRPFAPAYGGPAGPEG